MSNWISTRERLPGTDIELVLAVVSGRPEENIVLQNAYCLAEHFDNGEWMISEWPDWKGAEVSHWMPLPEPPEGLDYEV